MRVPNLNVLCIPAGVWTTIVCTATADGRHNTPQRCKNEFPLIKLPIRSGTAPEDSATSDSLDTLTAVPLNNSYSYRENESTTVRTPSWGCMIANGLPVAFNGHSTT